MLLFHNEEKHPFITFIHVISGQIAHNNLNSLFRKRFTGISQLRDRQNSSNSFGLKTGFQIVKHFSVG